MGLRLGEGDDHSEAATDLRADGENSSVGFGDRLDDGEPEPESLPVPRAIRTWSLEGLVETVEVFQPHDRPGIEDG
jgi:hypothetical protein